MLKFVLILLGSCWLIRSLFGLLIHYRFYHWIIEQYRIVRAKSAAALFLTVCIPSLILVVAYIFESILRQQMIMVVPVLLIFFSFAYCLMSYMQIRNRREVLVRFYARGGWIVWVHDWVMFLICAVMFYYALR